MQIELDITERYLIKVTLQTFQQLALGKETKKKLESLMLKFKEPEEPPKAEENKVAVGS